jgi:5'-nucleotidase
MNILLTNDDGIYVQGLYSLYEVLKDDHEFVVAPDSERSAVGHAITLVDPLRVRSVNRNGSFFGLALSGTPADCVKLAVHYSYPFRSHILFDHKFSPYTTNLVYSISG